jgi:Transglycosylase SLT domain
MFLFTSRAPAEAQTAASQPSTPFADPLRKASQATGVSFDYLARTAERESRFDPKAKAGTSSATGMFQFLDQTWLGMVKQEGPKLGLGQEAAAISGEGGRFNVSDPAMRQKILGLREDPGVSAMMAGAFASRNGQQMEQALGRKPSEGELYMAHFLGASGAKELIQLARTNPDANAAATFREAASANRSVFFDKSGRARSAQEVYAGLAASFSQPSTVPPQQTAATSDAAQNMFRAREGGKPLHGLFRSNGEPVADAVSDAWARMGRRPPVAPPDPTRVAFFPRESAAKTVAADAAGTPFLTALGKLEQGKLQRGTLEQGRGRVSVALPPERPAAQTAVQAGTEIQVQRQRMASRQARPLDLMQFMKPGQR